MFLSPMFFKVLPPPRLSSIPFPAFPSVFASILSFPFLPAPQSFSQNIKPKFIYFLYL